MTAATVYVDPTGAFGAGHAFIGLTDNNGNTKYYGYYPGSWNKAYGAGEVRNENLGADANNNGIPDRIENAKAITSKNISDTQYNAMDNYAKNRITNPGDYALPGEITNNTDNCTTFVGDVLGAGGIGNGFGNIPNAFEQDKKWNDWQNATPEDRARYLNNGGNPFGGYDPNGAAPLPVRRDPLALDLNHDGIINTLALSSSMTFFDMDNNGMSELTGWIAPTDGMLVYDKNNDGTIDSNNEQFGKTNMDGITELKVVGDSNGDNVFDSNDTLYTTLKVWTDTNGDGRLSGLYCKVMAA